MGIKYSTGNWILWSYKKAHYHLRHPEEMTGQQRSWNERGRKLDGLKEYLMGTLEVWRYLSLQQRAQRILEEKELKVDPTTLGHWYKRNGIKYLRAS